MDDDPSIVKIMKLYLIKNGYEVDEAFDGEKAAEKMEHYAYDLAVLDLMLPRKDGLAVCRGLRESGNQTPIIMLTARGEVNERVQGLKMGADDYLVKPFDPNELLARIESVIRRSELVSASSRSTDQQETLNDAIMIGNLSLLPASYSLFLDGRSISITRREFELLAFFVQRPGKVFTREDLISHVWGWDFNGEDRVVDLYVQRIRRKLKAGKGWSLSTVWGIGYKFEVNP
ncbi:response regulator transcription factor [Cohnella kolymensis]|uniref:response regulator transcription factor n=1 Tax=Cohnella kolymensis TaxID=1590652 RepID=UPI0006977AA5|nr:response regulator transcription factor [Cohnella kolymensis]